MFSTFPTIYHTLNSQNCFLTISKQSCLNHLQSQMSRISITPAQLPLSSRGETLRSCKSNSFTDGSANEPEQFPGFPSLADEACKVNSRRVIAPRTIPQSSISKVNIRSATRASVAPKPPRVPLTGGTSRGCKTKGVTNNISQEGSASQPKQFPTFTRSTPQSTLPKIKIRFNAGVSGASLPPRPPSGGGTLRRCKNRNVTDNCFPEGCTPQPKQPSPNSENFCKDTSPAGNLNQDSLQKVKIRFPPKVSVGQSKLSTPSSNGKSTQSKNNCVTHNRVKEGSSPQPKSPVFLSTNKETCKNVPAPPTARQNYPQNVSCDPDVRLANNILKSLLKSRFPSGKGRSHCKSDPSPKDQDPNCEHHQSRSSKNAGPGSKGWSSDPQHHHTFDNGDPAKKASPSKDTDMFTSNPCMSNYGSCGKTVNAEASSVEGTRTSTKNVNKMEEPLQPEFSSKKGSHDFNPSPVEGSHGAKGKASERTSFLGQHMKNDLFERVQKSVHAEVSYQDSCIITDREKMKETDEYKKVIEEEWACRRQVLQSQAEEAQRQRLLQRSSNRSNVVKPSHENKDCLFKTMPNKKEIYGEAAQDHRSCIINDREKLKETYEYRKVVEAEWASRQRVLQIQAEEAQEQRRLLKRKNAEQMWAVDMERRQKQRMEELCETQKKAEEEQQRMLKRKNAEQMRAGDMERRQKQRLEELRESQKKSEEQMNLKETVRADVRKELSKFEISCRNMACLLQFLGIKVGSKPKLDEVRAACKKALFTFHPDRFSKADVRHQVEAEEKFKLISRMKQKFMI